jgi:MFS transporter, DHA2 family, multidrug resistance protein
MMANGADAGTARRQAYKLLDLRILRQAAVLAYNHVFMLVAVLFLLAAPLLLLLKGGYEDAPSDFGVE